MPLQQGDKSYREIFREIILHHLYQPQEKYWTKELSKLILANTHYHGKSSEFIAGIHYLNQNWSDITDYCTNNFEAVFLPLHPDFLLQENKLLEVVGQLSELEAEKYEISRFISGLILFPVPIKVLQNILGSQLSQEIGHEFLTEQYFTGDAYLGESFEDPYPYTVTWDDNTHTALTTYIDQHKYLLKVINQRLLINLISQDQIKKQV